ncbi:MAG: cupredoxin domain-containing protein [Candidatus Pacebacteria bacterium]|nr:cupredoxin domain-containing protein [Candidatus Paceibacterota bacterium]
MSLDKIIVLVAGVLVSWFIYWFFLGKKDKAVSVSDEVDIIVDGGYSPEVISVPKGKITKLNFIRKDPTACLEEVVLGDFKIRRALPLNQKVVIEISPETSGEFVYTCGMGMYHGKIIVK